MAARRFFFPPRRCEAPGLKEGVGHLRYSRVPMQPSPGSALDVIEAECLIHLLVGLLANPACLDHCDQVLEDGLGRHV